MTNNLRDAETLVARLQTLASESRKRSGDEVAIDQLAIFGELLVALARHLDAAQQIVKWFTVVLTVLTVVLVVETAWLVLGGK